MKKQYVILGLVVITAVVGYFFLYRSVNNLEKIASNLDSRMINLDTRFEDFEKKIVLLREQGYVEADSTGAVVNNVLSSVVFISVKLPDVSSYNKNDTVLRAGDSNIRGTGFFISSDGYVVTAKHVVSELNTEDIEVKDRNGTRYEVDQVFMDEGSDVSLLKIKSGTKHTTTAFGYFENLEIGDEIGVIGFNPGFNTPLLHKGIVSAKGLDENGLKIFTINSFANKGNSGSPVFSLETGRILGVLSSRKSEAQTYKLIDPNKFSSGVSFGGNVGDPAVLSAKLYNETVKIVQEASQVGIGIVYSIDLARELMMDIR